MVSQNETLRADEDTASKPRSEVLKNEKVKLMESQPSADDGYKVSNGNGVLKHDVGLNKLADSDLNTDNTSPEFSYREGGVRAWLVVIASGYCFGILVGLLNDYSLLYNQMIKDFNSTENHILYAGN